MKFPKHLLLALLTLCFAHSQILAQNTDLRIDFTGTQPAEVSVGSSFAITAQLSLDVNGTTAVPSGEVVTAILQLKSPDGLILATHTETWNGFPEAGRSNVLDNDPRPEDQVIFQIPWSEAQKWTANAQWSITASVGGAAAENDLSDNEVIHTFNLRIPNLEVTNLQTSGTYRPGSQVTANVTVENTGQVRTQEGVFFPLVVRLLDASDAVLDQETVILPSPDLGLTPSLEPNQAEELTINNLRIPEDATVVTVQAVVDPTFAFQGHIVHETVEDSDLVATDNRQEVTLDIGLGNAQLQVDPDSFDGDMGTFRGLDPARLSFTVRNEGTAAIANTDDFTVQALLSEDDSYSTSDFILREFDFGGNALGTNLLPNETVSLDWIQQMPDNFEGDYYLLIRIIDGAGVDTVSVMDNTPTISLVSNNRGSTHLLVESNQQSTERPQSSADGQFVVYEETDNAGIQQIYFLDVLGNGAPELVSRNFQSNTATLGANSNSYRPRISSDGSSIVFHSRASDLVPGDLNDHEDVFLYRTASQQLIRAYDANANTEPNNGSFYPDINGDGTKIVFESEATNLQSDTVATTGRQIFLWDLSNGGRIRALTSGDGKSNGVTIDDSGTTVAFSSDATDLVANDDNSLTDVFVTKLAQTVDANDTTYLANLPSVNVDPSGNTRALGGKSDQAEISGDGSTIVYRSMATNLVTLKGISMIEVVNGGAGYFGNPTIVVTDQGGTGSGATLSLANAIDVYGQILPGGPTILSHGENYTNPVITIVSDPTQAAPAQQAVLEAHITHPQGELYLIKLADIDGTNLVPEYSKRISERNGVGGSMASRDPSISYDGETVVYATKSSNLLDGNVTREDGATFYNTPVTQATAQAILVGGIGEIEVQSAGSGYQSGFLKIEDYSGGGSGAIASYQVDALGRISTITMVERGSGYRLETTVISVDNPRGGTGFVAGEARFPQAGGIGANRSGGGSVHRVEMITPGSGYQQLSNTSFGAQALFSIDGDGVDVDSNGVADAKINPSRVHLDTQGGVYLEQKFDVEIVSTTSLATTVLTIGDANRTITVDFATNAALPFTIGLSGNDLSGIRDDLIGIIQTQWSSPTDLLSGPQIDDNSSGGTSFVLSGLSGTFTTNNPTSVSIAAQSNLLFSGSGFTRATPVIAPPPVIHGFSEILSSTSTTAAGNSRELESVQIDETTDDIYIYDALTQRNERVSRSTFGFPVNFLPSSPSSMPSNRFPSISGDARHIFFSSDAAADGGLAFSTSNQSPLDQNNVRDIYHHDRKLDTVPSPLSPQPALQSPQPATALVLAEVNATDPDQGLSDNFTVLTGGNSYRYPPTVELEGGGGSGATAVAVLKHGVIRKIDVLNPGYGYDPLRIRIKILDNGAEHNGTSGKKLAILEPKFNISNGIESIRVLDGGSGYHPSSSTLTVLVDYNGSSQGYGFEAGPVYTSDGIIDSVQLVNKGSGYQSAPSVKISGGGHEYPEGTPVHLRVVASEIAGIAEVRLIANGNLQPNRPLGSATPTGGGGFVDVVMNEPYFDVFWIPDRNPATGIGGVDGLGLWQLEVEVEDSMGKVTRTQAIEVKVVNTSPPICNILTPEDNAVFILDPSSPISLIAEASDEDGIITEVQFLIDNANTGFQGTESYVVNRPPYKLDWVASAIGTYEIKAIAIDNGLISTISDPITITVQEPVGEKPIAGWHFPADYNRENNNDPFDFFFFFGPTNNNDVDNDYAIGSSIPLNVSAVDDGSIVSVEFFVDNESIGFATKRYGSVYSYIWQSSQSEPALVFAKITDDDGNVVRTEVKTFNFGSNLGTKPLVELKYARRASGGNYEVNVMLKDLVQRNFFNREDGDLHLNLLVNGVQVSGSGSDPSNGLVNLGFETTNNPGDFFYNFSG
ncbi:MAG: Ig-like domain-containing protein, partial [Verrucomicrobiota bacterium]|nr:Ig-like domain-containing protein [Verrucomicrobiota bacterium]